MQTEHSSRQVAAVPARLARQEGGGGAALGAAVDLTIVVPAYNEDRRLGPTLDAMRSHLSGEVRRYEVLVVDDGSSDDTSALVRSIAAGWPELQLLGFRSNQGKGAAVRLGMLAAQGRLRLFSDADLSTPISELAKLEAEIVGGADIAIASRAVPESRVEVHQSVYRERMGRVYNLVLRQTVLPTLRDTQCGFKLFTAAAAELAFRELDCRRFGFDAEVLLRASLGGLKVAEVGVVWRNADGTRVNSLRDSYQMLVDIRRLRRQLSRQPARQRAISQRDNPG